MKVGIKMSDKKKIVRIMILIYCRGNKHDEVSPCNECKELIEYAEDRADNCISGELYCTNCDTPCYKDEMRERIKKVMKYSGPRMIIYHPILAIEHLWTTIF